MIISPVLPLPSSWKVQMGPKLRNNRSVPYWVLHASSPETLETSKEPKEIAPL